MLSGLYPGRIDLGLGRAPGTSSRVAHALQRDRRHPLPDDFREQLDGAAWVTSRDGEPAPYLLGSSPQSAVWAAELGLPYVFADFINPAGEPYAAFYREHFVPSAGRTRRLNRRSQCAPGRCAPRPPRKPCASPRVLA